MSNSNQVITLWDFENTWIPDSYVLTTLKTNIQTSLRKAQSNLTISGKVKAFGPGSGRKYSTLMRHSEHFEVISFPNLNKRCDGLKDNIKCGAEIVTGETSELIMRKTDIADKYLMLAMICESGNDKKLLIITGDSDFAELIYNLRHQFVNLCIFVALLPNSGGPLRSCCNKAWIWRAEKDDDPNVMINGGGPLTCKS